MSSPSTALLAALVSANGRPKRVLIQDRSSPFVSNIGRIAGATPLQVPLGEVDRTLRSLIEGERIGPDHVWAVATHRDGALAPPEWLSDCAPYRISTIDVCLGSLSALSRKTPNPSTFTIVNLDAEESCAGVHLTAFLTDDLALTERVRQMCLPEPNVYDYVFDASPRGLSHDEAGLMALVSGVIARIETETPALSGQESSPRRSAASFGLAWNRRFQPEENVVDETRATEKTDPVDSAPSGQGRNPWLALLSDGQTKLERLQGAHDELARRLQDAEEQLHSQARRTADAEASNQERADDLLRSKAETDRALASALREKKALETEIGRVEADRDGALAEAAKREEASRSAFDEQRRRALDLERDLAALSEREVSHAAAWETSRAQMLARIAQGETETEGVQQARDEALARALALEGDRASAIAEREGIAARLAEVERLGDRVSVEGAQREAALKAALDEQRLRVHDLERDLAALSEREVSHAAAWESSRAQMLARIAQGETETKGVQEARDEALARALVLEGDRASAIAEREGLAARLAEVERLGDRVSVEGAQREAALKAALDAQAQRSAALETDLAALNERGVSLSAAWDTLRIELLARVGQLEAQLLDAASARVEVLERIATLETDVESALSEQEQASGRLAQSEETRARLTARADELRQEVESLVAKNAEIEQRLLEADRERARAADLAEAKLAEARGLAETALARTIEGWRGKLEGAEQASEALKTALAARSSEAAAHERAHAVADAHRMALEDRVVQLQHALDAIRPPDPVLGQAVIAAARVAEAREEREQPRVSDRELAPWEMPRSRFAPPEEHSGDPSSALANDFIDFTAPAEVGLDGPPPSRSHEEAGWWRGEQSPPAESPRTAFTPEYEPAGSNPAEPGARGRGWLRGMASRIRRG